MTLLNQHVEPPRDKDRDLEAAVRLWTAVLVRAVEDLKLKEPTPTRSGHNGGYTTLDSDRLRRWFASERDEPGAFRWVCRVAGYNYRAILKGIPKI